MALANALLAIIRGVDHDHYVKNYSVWEHVQPILLALLVCAAEFEVEEREPLTGLLVETREVVVKVSRLQKPRICSSRAHC